ncbi:hypothetical protein [Singulisphaera sp. PoT]|uniref:hypothetical protein n=1 Tax=Singulisphaera sp. PoT TaxID=3411797 RepID=UPI003BF4AB99
MIATATEISYALVDPKSLRVEPPFSTLFPITPAIKASIVGSMREHGYDPSKPVNVWKGHNLLIDGHTRREAAIECEAATIPVCYHEFADEDAALAYAIANQRDRRNLTDVDLLRLIEAVDSREKRGGDRGNQHTGGKTSGEALPEKSALQTARIVGTSRSKVERARVILDEAKSNPTIKEEILSGKKTINMGSRQVLAARGKTHVRKKSVSSATQEFMEGMRLQQGQKRAAAAAAEAAVLEALDEVLAEPEFDEEEWLVSFPIRKKVVKARFDADALIYRDAELLLRVLKSRVHARVGVKSDYGQTLMHKAIIRLAHAAPPSTWCLCTKCNGSGSYTGSSPGKSSAGGATAAATRSLASDLGEHRWFPVPSSISHPPAVAFTTCSTGLSSPSG